VSLRIHPDAIGLLADLVGWRAVRAATRSDEVNPDGWQALRITIDWPAEVPGRLVALGDAVEVLAPAVIRQEVVQLAERSLARHRDR